MLDNNEFREDLLSKIISNFDGSLTLLRFFENTKFYSKSVWILSAGVPKVIDNQGKIELPHGFLKENYFGDYEFEKEFILDLYSCDINYFKQIAKVPNIDIYKKPGDIRSRIQYDELNSMNLNVGLYDMYLDFLEREKGMDMTGY